MASYRKSVLPSHEVHSPAVVQMRQSKGQVEQEEPFTTYLAEHEMPVQLVHVARHVASALQSPQVEGHEAAIATLV